ncbi:MAG: HAD-IIB family hydrolase [Pseudomonadota bacterium]
MHILSIALGGCLKAEPVRYGITEDTGGHISYILGAMQALAARHDVTRAEIVTRLFDAPNLGEIHARAVERVCHKCSITRIDSGNRAYLSKEALAADREAFTNALVANLRARESLPDIIHAHFADAADVAQRVQRELGIPYIYTAHSLGRDKLEALGDESAELRARIGEEDRAIAGAAAIIGSSRDECERQLIDYPSAKLLRIHRVRPGVQTRNGAPHEKRAAQLIAPFLREPEKPIILIIARPVHKKNLAGLVEAYARLPSLQERANLVILAGQRRMIGEGEPEQVEVISDMVDRIDRHDLHGRVAYPRTHDGDHVVGLYSLTARSHGVFVNPALMEPFGLTIVEAASHGLPVVATKIGGPLDTMREIEHGLLIDPCDPDDIGTKIDELLTDRKLWGRCHRNALERSGQFQWASYADAFVKIARPVCNAHSRGALEFALAPASRDGAGKAPMNTTSESLLVSDLDNTLTGCRKGVARLREFLERRDDMGFAIATGRSIIETRRIVREWDLPEPIVWITSVGTEIYWNRPEGPVRDTGFPALAKARWDPQAVERVAQRFAQLEPQPQYEQRDFKRSYFYTDARDVANVRAQLERQGIAARVVASHEELLDIMPESAGKAAAMFYVAGRLGIAKNRIFAAGDSGNDEDMLTVCANAIMVDNHAPEIAFLQGRNNLYTAKQSHAQGVVEGLQAHDARNAAKANTAHHLRSTTPITRSRGATNAGRARLTLKTMRKVQS